MNAFVSLSSALAKRRTARRVLSVPWFSPKYAIVVINFFYPKQVDVYFRWNSYAESALDDELRASTLSNYTFIAKVVRRYDVIVSDYALEPHDFLFFADHLTAEGTIIYIKEGVVYAGRSLADVQKV